MSSRERQQADLQEWAAKQLSVLPGEAPATVRSEFLRLVDKIEYFPTQEMTLAFEALTKQIDPDPAQPSQGLVWSLVEGEVGQDVDLFGCESFTWVTSRGGTVGLGPEAIP